MNRRIASLVCAAVVVAGACGSSDDGADGASAERAGTEVALLRAAATTTAGAGTSRLALEVVTEGGGEARTVVGEGVVDYERRRGRLRIDLGELGGSEAAIEQVFDGGTVYVKLPQLMRLRPGLKEWLRIDADDAGRLGSVLGGAGVTEQADPSQVLDFLRGVGGDVERVGEDEVRGEATTRYKATVDLRAAAGRLDGEAREQLDRAVGALGTSELPVEVWVDGDGRLRRFEYSLDLGDVELPEGAPPQAGTVRLRVELYDFGVEVDVEIPPEDQVSDAAELLGGVGAGVGGGY